MNIELSLKSNIELIVATSMLRHKLSETELHPIIGRIAKNFYYHNSADLAVIAQSIWSEYKDRKHVYRLLSLAYEMEERWRQQHTSRMILMALANPHAFDIVPMRSIHELSEPSLLELRNKLAHLTDGEFKTTPYFKAIRTALIQFCGGECQTRIRDIQCGRTDDLEVYYLSREHARGQEHIYYKKDMTTVCRDCLIRHQLGDPSGEVCHKVGIQII